MHRLQPLHLSTSIRNDFFPIGAINLCRSAPAPQAQTLGLLFGVPTWAVICALVVVAILGFIVDTRLERAHGGALTAKQLSNDDGNEFIEEIEIVSVRAG